jgi:hypothetical protein
MKSLMQLVRLVLQNMGDLCSISTLRDLKTVTERFEHEGPSFLTLTLPAFCSDFQKSLDLGGVADDHFAGFRRCGGLPRFLGGFLQLVFDQQTGRLLDHPSTDAVFAVRQITLLYSKILLPCSDARTRGAVDGYVECEKQVRVNDRLLDKAELLAFEKMSSILWSDVFQRVDEDIYYGRIVPKHGPGATADKLRGNAKFDQHEWTERLEGVFPHGEFLFSSWSHFDGSSVDLLEPGAERPVRVITVPKTLKTPRIIAVEPTCMQYVQQGIAEALLASIRQDTNLARIVGFDDQVPNQEMAQQGSRDGSLATLDLSEASDRVSNQLVRAMLKRFPNFAEGVDATRSRKADVPGHGVLRLAKFASMGSALCFPVEAIVFTTVVFLGIQRALNRPLTRRDIKSLVGQVRVFGDDIVVPTHTVHSVVSSLETFGFKVNAGKSFWSGKFRESCGKEYYDGHDVSISRVRRVLPTQRKHAQEIISAVSLRNQFYYAGLWGVAKGLDDIIGGLINFPTVLPTSPVLGRHSVLGFETQRLCLDLHRPLVRGEVVSTVIPDSNVSGHGALLKGFLKRSDLPFADRNHLERAGRPRSVYTRTRWASAV